MNLHNAEFIMSAAAPGQILHDGIPQLVFTGKSNVGKSSVINKLLNRKQFARVSATPGKTVHINYYLIDKTAYLVDLPGYGYARVAKSEYARWSKLMESFFSSTENIALAVMIVDSRHKPTADDVTMAQWYKETGCPFVVLANKFDKVKSSAREQNLLIIREILTLPENVEIIPFSAVTGYGRDALIAAVKENLSLV